MKKETRNGYLLVLPLICVFLLFTAYPLFSGIAMSFYNKRIGMPGMFVGFDNYLTILKDSAFISTTVNSFIYTLSAEFYKLILGLTIALVLNEDFKGRTFFRGLFLLPWILPTFVAAHTWRWIFDYNGILNQVLKSLGLIRQQIAWLGDPRTAMACIIFVNVWKGFPFFGLSFLAALQTIGRDIYEAADIDGASWFQQFRYITLPNIKSIIFLVLTLSTIWTFNDYVLVHILTDGGPVQMTNILPIYIFKMAFVSLLPSAAITAAMFLVPLLGVLIFALTRALKTQE